MSTFAVPVLAGYLYPPGTGVLLPGSGPTFVGVSDVYFGVLTDQFAAGIAYATDGSTVVVVDETLYAAMQAAYDALLPSDAAALAALAAFAAGFSPYVADPDPVTPSGLHVATEFPALTLGGTTTARTLTASYTPRLASSNLFVEIFGGYTIVGTGADTWVSTLNVGGSNIATQQQSFNASGGGGGRGTPLLPIAGLYTNASATAKTILVTLAMVSSDDTISIANRVCRVSEYTP